MQLDDVVYKVHIKDIDLKNMPNDEEYYFAIDLAGNKKVHRCKHIKHNLSDFRYVLLNKDQLK